MVTALLLLTLASAAALAAVAVRVCLAYRDGVCDLVAYQIDTRSGWAQWEDGCEVRWEVPR